MCLVAKCIGANDATAQCTLVAISFKHFGYQMLASWTEPFQEAFQGNGRVEVVTLSITEGWFLSTFLSSFLTQGARRNTPPERLGETLMYYGNEDALADFRDTLRMHNTLTGFVYLLDGLGRVRFAGSGTASQEESEQLIEFAKELTPKLKSINQKPSKQSSTRRKSR